MPKDERRSSISEQRIIQRIKKPDKYNNTYLA
jgi:hypothetical protein